MLNLPALITNKRTPSSDKVSVLNTENSGSNSILSSMQSYGLRNFVGDLVVKDTL